VVLVSRIAKWAGRVEIVIRNWKRRIFSAIGIFGGSDNVAGGASAIGGDRN